jgi:hypothetical protein
MLFAQTLTADGWVAVVIAILSGVLSYIAGELTRRYAWGKRDGEMEMKAATLATSLAEFKQTIGDSLKEIKEAAEAARKEIKADFARVYDLMGRSHVCIHERDIGELQAQVRLNADRVTELETWRHAMDRGDGG